MTSWGKDSPEVIKFMALFAKLKDWSDDDPDGLAELADSDDGVKSLCIDLSDAAHVLQMNERRSRALFAAPVDPAFVDAWRNFESRYAAVVAGIWLQDLSPDLEASEPIAVPQADWQWDTADTEAAEQSAGIEEAIRFAGDQADQDHRWDDDAAEFVVRIQEGTAAWDRLTRETGFDLRGVFRRRALVPFVLVPRDVSARHGSAEKLSLLTNLAQAHDAFVFGAPHAALGLMRSIMEAVLRDHYGVKGTTPEHLINNARGRLPPGANVAALHRLRMLANAVLHLDGERMRDRRGLDDGQAEKEIVSFLLVLRALVEGVK